MGRAAKLLLANKETAMSLKLILKDYFFNAEELLRGYGVELNNLSLRAAFSRAKKRKTYVETIIDVGASDGRWSLLAKRYFPESHYFLIEAQGEHASALKTLKEKTKNIDYIISAAGDKVGKIYFDASELFGGAASEQPVENNCITVPVVTIDSQVKQRSLKPPFLLKLDTHGFEIPIFEGAKETLSKTQLIVVEVYNFQLTGNSLRFHQMCQYLEDNGFRCVDLCEPMHRAKDKSLWQMDLFFVPSTHEVFQSNSYI